MDNNRRIYSYTVLYATDCQHLIVSSEIPATPTEINKLLIFQ